MAASYNSTTIVGNVGRDPDMKYLDNGTALCTFSVAVNSKKKGEQVTEWFKVTTWRQLAEVCNQYVRKGMVIMATGELTIERYTNKQGEAQATAALSAKEVVFMSRSSDSAGSDDMSEPDMPSAPKTDVPF